MLDDLTRLQRIEHLMENCLTDLQERLVEAREYPAEQADVEKITRLEYAREILRRLLMGQKVQI